MRFRSPVFNQFGTIDCEIEHPQFGWIPFTADPNDAEPIGAAVFEAAQPLAAPYAPPPPEPEPVPQTVSRFQARAALHLAGKLTDAEAAVEAAAAENPLIAMAWREAVEFKRTSPALNALAEAIGMTPEDVDNLFRLAATIET
jgi:hypothetical protein